MLKRISAFTVMFMVLCLSCVSTVHIAHAADLLPDTEETIRGTVTKVVSEEMVDNPGLSISSLHQVLEIRLTEGVHDGETVTIDNDYVKLSQGDRVFIRHITRAEDGKEIYTVSDPDRMPVLIVLTLIFVLLIFIFGGIQGVRGLVSLAGSFALIIYVLLPNILAGYSPILISIGVSSLIIIVGSYITHGFKRVTTAAVIGMIITVALTGLLAYTTVDMAKLSGFSTDESVYLNASTQGMIDLPGLLLGGIMIGLLGVLYDIAIGQAVSVEELHHIAKHINRRTIYRRAIRIGREHIGALVNTLAIAYVGVSLPLLLLFYNSPTSSILSLNREIFATEIIRILIGSIGIVLAVPITTFISTLILVRKPVPLPDESILPPSRETTEAEMRAIKHFEHHH